MNANKNVQTLKTPIVSILSRTPGYSGSFTGSVLQLRQPRLCSVLKTCSPPRGMLSLVCFTFTILICAVLVMSRPLSVPTLRLRLSTGMQNRTVLWLATFARGNRFSSCTIFMLNCGVFSLHLLLHRKPTYCQNGLEFVSTDSLRTSVTAKCSKNWIFLLSELH